MKKIGIVLTLVASLLGPVACPAGSSRGGREETPPPVGWDGTNYTRCDLPAAPPPGPRFGPRKGYIHILVVVTADIYTKNPKGGRDICHPNAGFAFKIRLDGNVDGVNAIKLDQGRPTPWVANLITPHFEHIFVVKNPRYKRWVVTVDAIVTPGQVRFEGARAFIRCAIFVNGDRTLGRDQRKIDAQSETVTSCAASGNVM